MRRLRHLSLMAFLCIAATASVAQQRDQVADVPAAASQPVLRDGSGRAVEPGIASVFDRLGEGIRDGDEGKIKPLLDVRRLFEEIVASGMMKEPSPRVGQHFRTGLGIRLAQRMASGTLLGWERHEIVRAQMDEARDESVVLVKTWDSDGWVFKFRWWLLRRDGAWRIYDWQEVSMPLRASVAIGIMLGDSGTDKIELPSWAPAARDMVRAFEALTAEDLEQASLLLARTAEVEFPPYFDAIRELALGFLQLAQSEPAKALEHYEKVEMIAVRELEAVDYPILHYVRAVCYNEMGRHEEALVEARQSLAKLGDDAQTYQELGVALAGLGKKAEAAAAFRKGLADSPAYADNVLELAKVLPREKLDEFAERFTKLPDAADYFEVFAIELIDPETTDALEVLVKTFRKMRPDDPNGDYYAAQAMILREKYDAAAALLKAAIPRVEDDEERGYYIEQYVDALLWGGKPLEAYAAAPNPHKALHQVGDYLADVEDADNLRKLIAAHRGEHSQDLWLHYYDGRAADFAGDHDKAEQAFGRGYEAVTADDDRELFRSWRVSSLYQAGKWKIAIDELGKTEATFAQLAVLMSAAGNADELRSLVALQRKATPDSPRLALWEAEIAWIRKDYEAVVERLEGFGKTIASDDDEYARYDERLLRSLVRIKRFERALEVAKASTERDGNDWYEIVVYAAAGDAERMLETIGECIEHACYRASELYEDDDIGEALKRDALESVRKRYPKNYKPSDGEPK